MLELRMPGDKSQLVADEEFLNQVYFRALNFLMTDFDLFELIKFSYNAEMSKYECAYELDPYGTDEHRFPVHTSEVSEPSYLDYPTDQQLLDSFRILNLVVIDRKRKRFSIAPQREVW